ncbi:MAG: (Fe-S)-binding protein [Deltaproteobacteria bacterium RBG_19FT_COMBO_43_11]|nr:MAG: (Fe-S)-binding protein [Deltaproteobacteria bacterium RBG_16_44_11]OGP88336.1 MAG: (Fe-S)-binding protein [Deltaproteobacteria bacterium RBG_19FT_COMBO_43_11]
MAHHNTIKANSYNSLAQRLNRFPQGAPPTELLFKILKVLFSEREAKLVSRLPIKPFTDKKAAAIWKLSLSDASVILNDLADRGILLDYEEEGNATYVLPPPMAGFFEFSMMRYRKDIDQKVLSELFYQYLNVEEDFIKDLFLNGETQLGRVFVNEGVLTNENALHVLDFERASEVIKTASQIGVGVCYCRHKMEHVGLNCGAPMDICMTFNAPAESLVRHKIARKVDAAEGLDLLNKAQDHNLVQFGENVQERVGFICNCCGCCCEALIAARKFGFLNPVHTTNFIPEIIEEKCNGCGKCVSLCPVEAMTLVTASDPHKPEKKKAKLDDDQCLGCGVCLKGCIVSALKLKSRSERVITPVNSVHRVVLMAIERGKFQNLLFDNQLLLSHRAMAAVLGVILKLPPAKQILASNQFKSRYLLALIKYAKR